MLLLFFLAKPIFKDYFSRPNSMMYSFGGDALMLYYNTAYHTRYDQGSTLRSMNYPDGEYIYLTDAQGSVSNTLQWINRHVTDISGQTVGFVNGLNLYLLFAAVVLLFFLLRALGVHTLLAILFAPLILLLSPQIWRMGGHFGLAYPFLIPMAMLWFVRKYRVGRLEKRDAAMLALSLFFTFNNPYTGFNLNFFLIVAGLLVFALEGFQKQNWKRPAIISGMGLLVLGITFLNFKLFDPVPDRVDPQWGFFYYHARFEGIFYPTNSILYNWLKQNGMKPPDVDFETMLNVGIITTLAIAAMLLMALSKPFLRENKPVLQKLAPEHRVLLGATFLLFLMAANTSIIPISKTWLEAHMGWMLMFKAAGRLAWGFYFALTLTGVVLVDRLFRMTSPRFMAVLFVVLVAAVWNAEINQYTRIKFKEVFQENFFDRKHEQEMLDVLQQNHIDVSQFQAMMSVPKMIAWSDKILSDVNFNTQFYSVRMSLATGLPMVNSMLSRIGMQQALDRVQMLSNPLIDRKLPARFPNQKDILLLAGADAIPELKKGEQFLLSISQPLAVTKNFSLYRLRLADLADNESLRKARTDLQNGAYTEPSLHLGYDEKVASRSFYGGGSHQTLAGEEKILDFPSPFERDTQMVFSAWTYLDHGPWSGGFWLLKVQEAQGAEIHQQKIETRKFNDVQDNWIRAEARVPLPRGARLQISAFGDKPLMIDEIMLWPLGATAVVRSPREQSVLYDNFRISSPH